VKALMLAWSSPGSDSAAGRAAFDTWYDTTHIPQIRAAVGSITGVSRFRLVDPESGQPENRYLAVYELDEADIPAAAAALGAAAAAGRIQLTPAIDLGANPPDAQWYQAHLAGD
jgi:hypothetical protein